MANRGALPYTLSTRGSALIRSEYHVRLGSNRPALFLVGAGLLLTSSAFVGLLGEHVYRTHRLAAEGLSATGTVVKKVLHRAGDYGTDGTSYEVDYLFTSAAGPRLKGSDTVDAATWDQMTEGGPVEIEYAAGRPQINQIGHKVIPSLGTYLAVACGVVLWLLGATLAFQGLRPSLVRTI